MRVLITGAYGFLGYSVSKVLLEAGHTVIGVDKVVDAISEKTERIQELSKYPNFIFYDRNLSSWEVTEKLFVDLQFDMVVHFAAQYSVHHTTKNVLSYIDGNLRAFTHIIEACRIGGVKRFIYASSTFVQEGRLPRSMYGATKEYNERCAHLYSSEHGMETIGLRFASTYGPHMRPDTGMWQCIRKLFAGHPIDVSHSAFTNKIGFLFIEDAVEVVLRCMSFTLPERYNVHTVVADDFLVDMSEILALLEKHSGLIANRQGVSESGTDTFKPSDKCRYLESLIGYSPDTKIDDGVKSFVKWYATRHENLNRIIK